MQQGANIDTTNKGQTALLITVGQAPYNYTLATELINKDANLHIKDQREHDALYATLVPEYGGYPAEASKSNPDKINVALLLLQKGAVISHDEDILRGAVEAGSLELVDKLLQNGAVLNTSKRSDYTYPPSLPQCINSPLSKAAELGNNTMVEFLLKKGAAINGFNGSCSPLIAAIEKKQEKTALLLINKGADINAKDSNDMTVLMKATDFRLNISNKLLSMILQRGADINAVGPCGQTALTEAALGPNDPQKMRTLFRYLKPTKTKTVGIRQPVCPPGRRQLNSAFK